MEILVAVVLLNTSKVDASIFFDNRGRQCWLVFPHTCWGTANNWQYYGQCVYNIATGEYCISSSYKLGHDRVAAWLGVYKGPGEGIVELWQQHLFKFDPATQDVVIEITTSQLHRYSGYRCYIGLFNGAIYFVAR